MINGWITVTVLTELDAQKSAKLKALTVELQNWEEESQREKEREREIERAFCDGEENASLNNFFFLITLHWINWLQTHCLYIRLESGNKERITDYKNNFQLTRN